MFEQRQFQGGVFHESIRGGRAGATVELSTSGVDACTSAGQRFSISFRDCEIEIGGASGRMVFCRTGDRATTIFCEEKSFIGALEMECGSELKEKLAAVLAERRSQNNSGRLWLMFGLVATVLVLVGGYYGLLALARASMWAVPVSVDQKIGELAFNAMQPEGAPVDDLVIVDAVKAMVARLEPHSELKGLTFDVKVIDSEQVNAFCLPGGKIVVYTGLLKNAHNAEQVAGVLSHEMAHAIRRHGLQQVTQSLGIVTAVELLIGDVGGLVALGVELGKSAALTSYSREYEIEADITGARMMHAAQLDPLALAEFFEVLKDQGNEIPGVIAWLSTHPQHEIRIQTIRGELANLGAQQYLPLDVNWDDVQERLKQLNVN